MASSNQFERLLPLLALAGAGVAVIVAIYFPVPRKRSSAMAVFQKRKNVPDFDYFIKEHTGPKKDYITRLPDDILCLIISYLDMKDAVRTSVLSSRWRKLYCTLPNPKFECHKMFELVTLTEHNNWPRKYKQRFVNAVDKMVELVTLIKHNCHRNYEERFVTAVDKFLHRRSGLPMKSFTLRFCLKREFSIHLRSWLNCILISGVEKLDLNFRCNEKLLETRDSELIVFPFKVLLSACMLEYVRLSFCILEPYFQGPFNSLKELSLYSVPLVNGEVESILTSCPQLRLWNLQYCKLPCKLLVNALELRTLEIIYCEQVNEIGFSAPNLDYFIYFGKGPLSFSPSYVPNLGTLRVGLVHDNRPQHGFEGLGGFVFDAPCLNKLWIQATPNQVVRYIQEMPTLWNLHVLSLHVIKGSLDLRDIISLIAVFPNLSTFSFSSLNCSLNYKERDAEMLPTYVHLKLVVLDGFKFDAAQERFASQLIRCAPALEEMSIYTEHCFYPLGIESKKTLPLEKRVFSNELILRTQLLLKQQSLSSAIIQFITPSLVFRL